MCLLQRIFIFFAAMRGGLVLLLGTPLPQGRVWCRHFERLTGEERV